MRPGLPVRARLPSLFVQRRGVVMTRAAAERLLSLAERQSEGAVDGAVDPPTYYGSTYFAIGLSAVRAAFAGRTAGEMTAGDLARAVHAHPWFRLGVARAAREEAERRIARPLAPGTARVLLTARQSGDTVTVEAAVELPCAVAEVRRAAGC
ncbi:MAG: hypothetical protein QME96_15300 [Myxococcota bacterium]|nr:hypothetical protein [Myxococcota bacterium]